MNKTQRITLQHCFSGVKRRTSGGYKMFLNIWSNFDDEYKEITRAGSRNPFTSLKQQSIAERACKELSQRNITEILNMVGK